MKRLKKRLLLILGTLFLTSCQTHQATVISYGSSSLYYMHPKLKSELDFYNVKYISNSIGGQIIETMSALQGSNPIKISFDKNEIQGKNSPNPIIFHQKYELGSLRPKGKFEITLSNGIKGTLDFNKKTFSTSAISETITTDVKDLDVNFGFENYRYNAIHIFNIGKNNITMGNYTPQQIMYGISLMIDYLESNGNDKYIVCGYYVDRDMPPHQKKIVIELNSELSKKYGSKYFDIQNYLLSEKVWKDIEKRPTPSDIKYQRNYELAPSLSRDSKHLSSNIDSEISYQIKEKLISLKYFN